MKSFEIKTKIFFGDQALDRLKQLPYEKVLIITDPFVVQSKMIELITTPLKEAGIHYDIFKEVVPDPPIEKISEGVKAMLAYKPEAIVAVGGGSAIDSSKSIREFALPLMVGILCGGYSSVCVTGALWYVLKTHQTKK